MATELERFRDHCRAMAEAEHKPECVAALKRWIERDLANRYLWRDDRSDIGSRPECSGCNPAADRALFIRLADEVDAYLTHDDAPLWEEIR